MVKKWSIDRDSCDSCGRVEVRHHAKGLCRTCYAAKVSEKTNGWPTWLNACIACKADRSNAYRASGLCRKCHRSAERHGVLAFWRLLFIVKKSKAGAGDRAILLSVIRKVGLSATARIMQEDSKTVYEYAIGMSSIDKEVANRIMDAFIEVET